MSANFFYFISSDPFFTATSPALYTAAEQLANFLPGAEEITVGDFGQTRFFNPGVNLLAVRCPNCGADLLASDDWPDLMDVAFDSYYLMMEVQVPCCGETHSLNDLEYDWPAGFAHWAITVKNPGVAEVLEAQLESLRNTLGCELRVVRQRGR